MSNGEDNKKHFIWVLSPEAIEEGVKSTTRYRKSTVKKAPRSEARIPQRQQSGRRGGRASKRFKALQAKQALPSTPTSPDAVYHDCTPQSATAASSRWLGASVGRCMEPFTPGPTSSGDQPPQHPYYGHVPGHLNPGRSSMCWPMFPADVVGATSVTSPNQGRFYSNTDEDAKHSLQGPVADYEVKYYSPQEV